MLGRTDSRARLGFVLVAFALAGCALVARLGYWQVAQRDTLADAAHRQIYIRLEEPARRGTIYDRSGVVVLAGSVTRDRLAVSAERLTTTEREAIVGLLTDALGLDQAGADAIRAKLDTKKPYVILATDLTAEKSEVIREGAAARGITDLSFESDAQRTYPQVGGAPGSTLAASMLGFVNRDGKGQYGVEQYYQDILAGTPRVVEADKDANGQPLIDTERTIQAGAPGSDVRLTIDAGLQLALEQELMSAVVADKSAGASAVVMDPYTGEIYASANYPTFDANDYSKVAGTDPGLFQNPVISSIYEPGSVFKLMTVIAGLEGGTVGMNTIVRDSGVLRLDGGRTMIADADRTPMGDMKMEDGIAYSRNVVAARVALGLKPTLADASSTLFAVWKRMGFGSRTGIDLAGEAAGLLNDPSANPWREIDLANGSFGQGVGVTQIQLAAAYAAMMNGGTLVTPHVVASVAGKDVAPTSHGRVLDASMTPQLVDLLNHVVTSVPFYRQGTLIPGYWVGGKSGTAQIWDSTIHAWKSNIYNFSFIGFVGRRVGHPDLAIAVRISEGRPTSPKFGQLVMPIMSFELFRRIATDAITTPGLLPDLPVEEVPVAKAGA